MACQQKWGEQCVRPGVKPSAVCDVRMLTAPTRATLVVHSREEAAHLDGAAGFLDNLRDRGRQGR